MKRLLIALLALSAAPAAARAQATSAVATVGQIYAQGRDYVIAAAEQMPEADYAFKPTPEVRSFGQLVGHVTNAQFFICAAALGEQSAGTRNYEEVTEKTALIEALRASSAVCDRAYQQSDESAAQIGTLFGEQHTRFWMLALNASHDFEHYGNMITYLRLKGMVPPSSQGN